MTEGILPLAVTPGDPAGIGAEITLAAWRERARLSPFFLIDDPDRLSGLSAGLPLCPIAAPEDAAGVFAHALPVLPHAFPSPVVPGRAEPANAPATVAAIERAVAFARSGRAAGVVTNPVNKAVLYEGADFRWPGHTEYLAHLGGVARTVMMLTAPGLRVVPVTVHIALAEVPRALTGDEIFETAQIAAAALRQDFGIDRPRIWVAGLNPHAGERGAMGREEIEVIAPALARLRAEGIDVTGPLPADTMFHTAARARYDAALTMYHDQGLVALKTLDFERGVNVTLGLPFVRTSPDHGTAYDIAGTAQASPASLVEAIRTAGMIAAARTGAAQP